MFSTITLDAAGTSLDHSQSLGVLLEFLNIWIFVDTASRGPKNFQRVLCNASA